MEIFLTSSYLTRSANGNKKPIEVLLDKVIKDSGYEDKEGKLFEKFLDFWKAVVNERYDPKKKDQAMDGKAPGGIDLNATNLNLLVQSNGIPLEFSKNVDLAQWARIEGFEPHILEIKPVGDLPIFQLL